MFSSKIGHFWAENTFFLILFSRREGVGNTNLSIFPVLLIQLSPIFVHMVLVSHPTYPAKNFLIESPLVYFLVCVLIKITILVEISSWPGRRELPIAFLCSSWPLLLLVGALAMRPEDGCLQTSQLGEAPHPSDRRVARIAPLGRRQIIQHLKLRGEIKHFTVVLVEYLRLGDRIDWMVIYRVIL